MTTTQYPKNPVCGRNNRPRELGITRSLNGQLQYRNPLSGQWEGAIRLQDARAEILRQADPRQYTFAKANGDSHGREPTNYTSFLPKDKDIGPARENRPDVLFQIAANNPRGVKPTGYVKHNHLVVLDAFDHGLRAFSELPVALSSELEGNDIEYYYRQNSEISDYDLIARMPNGYWTGKDGTKRHEGPPRVGTINQRAQRWRTKAACIAWCKREGTRSKNEVILSMIPAGCKDSAVNSTKGFRDLNRHEQKVVEDKNRGTMPTRARGGKKAEEHAESDNAEDEERSDAENEALMPPQRRSRRQHPEISFASYPTASRSSEGTRARRRQAASTMVLNSSSDTLHNGGYNGQTGDKGEEEESVEHQIPVGRSRTTINRETGTKSYAPKAVSFPRPTLENATDGDNAGYLNPREILQILPHAESSAPGRKRKQPTDHEPGNEHAASHKRARASNTQQTPLASNRHRPTIATALDHSQSTPAAFNQPNSSNTPTLHQLPPTPAAASTATSNLHTAWTRRAAVIRRARGRPKLEFNPETDEEFQAETQAGIISGDYRYMAPEDHGNREEDIRAIDRALELTRIQFCRLKGMCVPLDFAQYRSESYASQWRRIQDQFEKVWRGCNPAIPLYRLPKWRNSFSNWRVPNGDAHGRGLLSDLLMGERQQADMEREWAEEDRKEEEEKARQRAEKEREESWME